MTKNRMGNGMMGKKMTAGFAAVALVSSMGLTACGEAEVAEAPVEGVVDGLEVTNARLVLAPVAGNPAAVYFDVAYNADRGIAISGAEVAGAGSAVVHNTIEYNFEMTMSEAGPLALTNGTTQTFEPGGLHIMANDLDESVTAGSTAEVTLKISGGQTHKFDAEVREAGEER